MSPSEAIPAGFLLFACLGIFPYIECPAIPPTHTHKGLMTECGLSADEASESAPLAFETYLNQEGYTARDEEIFRIRNKSGVS